MEQWFVVFPLQKPILAHRGSNLFLKVVVPTSTLQKKVLDAKRLGLAHFLLGPILVSVLQILALAQKLASHLLDLLVGLPPQGPVPDFERYFALPSLNYSDYSSVLRQFAGSWLSINL